MAENPSIKKDLFQQTIALMNASGMTLDEHTRALMQPLITGEMSYEEHRAMLLALLEQEGP